MTLATYQYNWQRQRWQRVPWRKWEPARLRYRSAKQQELDDEQRRWIRMAMRGRGV